MPDFWSHHYAAIAAREKYEVLGGKVLRWSTDYDPIYYFGAQGPDFFYYINNFKFYSKVRYGHIGNAIHHNRPEKLFRLLFGELLLNPTPVNIAYVSGFVSHYILDVYCHPIICELGPDSHSHKRVEMALEALCLFNYWKLTPKSLNIDLIRCSNDKNLIELTALWNTSLSTLNLDSLSKKEMTNGHYTMLKIQSIIKNNTISILPFTNLLSRIANYDLSLLSFPNINTPHVLSDLKYNVFIERYEKGIDKTAEAYLLIDEILSHQKSIDAFIETYVIEDYLGEET